MNFSPFSGVGGDFGKCDRASNWKHPHAPWPLQPLNGRNFCSKSGRLSRPNNSWDRFCSVKGMLTSKGSLLIYVIVLCDVIATLEAHTCRELMLSPSDRRVGRKFPPALSVVYQLRLATSSANDADKINSDAQLKQNEKTFTFNICIW